MIRPDKMTIKTQDLYQEMFDQSWRFLAEHFYEASALAELLGVPADKVNEDRLYRQPQLGRLLFEVSRHPTAFLLTVTWPADIAMDIGFFASIEEPIRSLQE